MLPKRPAPGIPQKVAPEVPTKRAAPEVPQKNAQPQKSKGIL